MRTTFNSPIGYWIAGALILWLMAPAAAIDILIDPGWHAPNPQCDSIGIPIMGAVMGLLPTAIIAILITAPVFFLGRNRTPGADIFDWRLGTPPWKWIATLIALAIVGLIAYDLGLHVWMVSIPQIITADCGGRGEPVVLTMRAPALQFFPLWEIAFGAWVLHVRVLVLAPRLR